MMTVTQTPASFSPEFEVTVDGQWAGRVWATRGFWTAQDFDGDTEDGFQTMLGAAQWVEGMRGAMV